MNTLLADLRYASHSLRRTPGVTTVAVLSLALGIGANTAIFSLMDQALFRLLPARAPEQLFLLDGDGFSCCSSRGNHTFSYPMYTDLRDSRPDVFSDVAARYQDVADLAPTGAAERANVELVSGNYFPLLGVGAALGRTITPEDNRPGAGEPVAVLSYGCWKRRFGSDESILNRSIHVNGRPMTVIGVATKTFKGLDPLSPADLFVPIASKAQITPTWDDLSNRASIWLNIVGRLKPGVDPKQAAAAATLVYRRALAPDQAEVQARHHFSWNGYLRSSIRLMPLARAGVSGVESALRQPLGILFCMVGALLLLACINVAGLLVARAAARNREIAIRLSLGATRFRLMRLLIVESLLLSGAGGLLALLVSAWTSELLLRLAPRNLFAAGAIQASVDGRILLFTLALSLLTAVLFGFVPALQATRTDLAVMLKGAAAAVSLGSGQVRLRRGLVAAQTALSLLLLCGAGLFVRSLHKVLAAGPGPAAARFLTFSVDPSLQGYKGARAGRLFLDLQARLHDIPGVASVTAAGYPLLAGACDENTLEVQGYRQTRNENMQATWEPVLPGFFATMQKPLLIGREFTPSDSVGAPKVVIVNETLVKRFFGGRNPIGRHLGFLDPQAMEIIGVARDVNWNHLKAKPTPWTYTPALQNPLLGPMTYYLRTDTDPLSLAGAVRQAVHQLDASLPVVDVKTLEMQIAETHALDRLCAWLSTAFALLATLLATIGLHGLTAYTVTRRTREIGIRMALGAGRPGVLWIVLREALLLAALGLAIGIPASLALGKLIQTQLFEISSTDPAVIAASAALILAVSLLAAYLPARRAARIDPVTALHCE